MIEFLRRCLKKALENKNIDTETYYDEKFTAAAVAKRRRRRGIFIDPVLQLQQSEDAENSDNGDTADNDNSEQPQQERRPQLPVRIANNTNDRKTTTAISEK